MVAFSDSRQDAAELANGIERSHYTDLVREAMYEELLKAAVDEPHPDLLATANMNINAMQDLPDQAPAILKQSIADAKDNLANPQSTEEVIVAG